MFIKGHGEVEWKGLRRAHLYYRQQNLYPGSERIRGRPRNVSWTRGMGSDLITVALGSRLGLWVNHHGLSPCFVHQEPEGTQTVEV